VIIRVERVAPEKSGPVLECAQPVIPYRAGTVRLGAGCPFSHGRRLGTRSSATSVWGPTAATRMANLALVFGYVEPRHGAMCVVEPPCHGRSYSNSAPDWLASTPQTAPPLPLAGNLRSK
jgi:hypothetical protein